jgi:PKD repeat protein
MGARPVVRRPRGRRPLRTNLPIALFALLAMAGALATDAHAGRDKPPVARLTVTQVPVPPVTVRADASTSTDKDPTPIIRYQFDFGDGSPVVVLNAPNAIATHTYGAAGGTYTVSVTAIDGANLTGTASRSIVVVPEKPPVARLSVTQLSSPFFTVSANGSASTDADPTPIASYRFNFGDGSPVVTTSTATAQHTYGGQGSYTVTLIATDTGGYVSNTASVTINVVPPPENPPVARLSVTQTGTLTVVADGSTSSDNDLTPIASYRFSFGDGSAAVVTSAPSATAQHVYGGAGTYTVSLTATDTGGNVSAPASTSVTVGSAPTGGVAVYAGYYDTHHTDNLKAKPNPWRGSSNVVFVGVPDPNTANGWDTSALRIVNLTGAPLSGVNATVDMGTHHFALWSANTIPAGYSLILAQTGLENFDGSDTSPAGCYSCNPNDCLTKVSSAVPVVHLTIGSTTTNYYDPNQVLNTKGADAAGCPYTGTRNDESEAWQKLGTTAPAFASASGEGSSSLEIPPQPDLWMAPPYPNPAGRAVTVRFGMPRAGEVKLGVYDVAGRLVRSSVAGNLGPGSYVDIVDVSDLRPGAYFCTLWTPSRTLHQAFVIAR